jgi:hypothetical protein
MLIVSPVSGTVSVPFPMNAMSVCVSFIGVTPVFDTSSSQIGCGDNSNPSDDGGVVVAEVVSLVVVVVVAPAVVVLFSSS